VPLQKVKSEKGSIVIVEQEDIANDTPAFTTIRKSPSVFDLRKVIEEKKQNIPVVSDYNYTASEDQQMMGSTFLTPSELPLQLVNM
jgi:hypothetical protein